MKLSPRLKWNKEIPGGSKSAVLHLAFCVFSDWGGHRSTAVADGTHPSAVAAQCASSGRVAGWSIQQPRAAWSV